MEFKSKFAEGPQTVVIDLTRKEYEQMDLGGARIRVRDRTIDATSPHDAVNKLVAWEKQHNDKIHHPTQNAIRYIYVEDSHGNRWDLLDARCELCDQGIPSGMFSQ